MRLTERVLYMTLGRELLWFSRFHQRALLFHFFFVAVYTFLLQV